MAQLSALPIDTFVRKDSIAVEPDFPLQKAIQLMIRYSLSALPVVQQQALIGILSLPDLFGRISD